MSRQHRILVVDDDSLNLSIMEEILEDHYSLAFATSGEECLDIAPMFKPDLILLDIMMPGIDGYETCRRLRREPQLRFAKVVLVSAKVQLHEKLEGYESLADDYITKPFESTELLAKVRVMLRLQYAEEMQEFKAEFLGLLGHETRTPLTGIISPAQLLVEDDSLNTEERAELHQMILDSASSLHRLVQRTLDLCAYRADRATLQSQPVELSSLIGSIVEDLQSQAHEKAMTFDLDIPESLQVMGDLGDLRKSLHIILDNAVVHGQPGSGVRVHLSKDGESTVVQVENQGELIPEEEVCFVFEAFRVKDFDHYSRGVGVDLALAREIALAHGGDLTCRAVPPNTMVFALSLLVAGVGSAGPASGNVVGSGVAHD